MFKNYRMPALWQNMKFVMYTFLYHVVQKKNLFPS